MVLLCVGCSSELVCFVSDCSGFTLLALSFASLGVWF